jgi:hypothetical protein
MAPAARQALIDTLRRLLGEAFAVHQKGAVGARLGRSYGKADGFMLALIESGLATQQELSRVVVEERTRRLGPGSQTLSAGDTASGDTASGDTASGDTLAA